MMTDDLTPPDTPQPVASNWLASEPPTPLAPPPPPASAPFTPWAVFAFITGLAGAGFGIVVGLLFAILTATQKRGEGPLFASLFISVGALGAPLAWHAWRRMKGQASSAWRSNWRWIAAAATVIAGMLACGQLFASLNWIPALAAALAQPIILVAAAASVLALALGNWRGLSRLRVWGHLLSGAWLAIILAFLVEIVLIGGVGLVAAIVWAVIAPDQLMQTLEFLQSLDSVASPDLSRLASYALNPWVIGLAFLGAAVVIPLLEELIKPIGLILLINRKPAPMAAFLGGVLGGLGFAITESLSNLITLGDPWFLLVVARLGTLTMHAFTSGLAGWGLGELAGRKPLRALAAYAGAVAVHGLWNGMVVMIVFSGLYVGENPDPNSPMTIGLGLLAALGGLVLVSLVPACVGGLALIGYRLRSSTPQ